MQGQGEPIHGSWVGGHREVVVIERVAVGPLAVESLFGVLEFTLQKHLIL
jgi:hypothetical protein